MIKPILFNTDMVRAILANRKTVTRRVVKPQPAERSVPGEAGCYIYRGAPCGLDGLMNFAPHHPGDILYVREKWRFIDFDFIDGDWSANVQYGADEGIGPRFHYLPDGPDTKLGWHPSIHMPREAARIFLRVTDVRVERLQDSFFKYGNTIFCLQREGIDIGEQCRECIDTYGSPICNDSESECGILDEVRGDFSDLWDSTIKKSDLALYGWAANPWVWVIEFERCEKPEEEIWNHLTKNTGLRIRRGEDTRMLRARGG